MSARMVARHPDLLDELLALAPEARVLRMLDLGMVPLAGGAEGDGEGEGAEGAGDGTGGEGEGAGGEGAGGEGAGGDGSGAEGDGEGAGREPDWKSQSRKHERRAKTEKQRADELQAKLDEIASANASEQEKAIATARAEAQSEVTSKYETERRSERLELAVTRHATKGIKVGDGDDAKTVKFADPDDAIVHLERAITRGDIDKDDIFDENGKVQPEGLTAALAELLDDKPHLAARAENGGSGGGPRKPAGGADAGRGSGADLSLAGMSVEEHIKRQARPGR